MATGVAPYVLRTYSLCMRKHRHHQPAAYGTAGRTPLEQPPFLPMDRASMLALGWEQLDVLLITGDAYVDHPSFAAPLLGRWLVAHGYRTGIVAQPRWDMPDDVLRMGRPRLFAGVTAGALDSMLAHYTAFRKKRNDDAYTPGGRAGARPNRAVIVYSNLVRRAFPGLPLVLGGIEASLRRISHYDFWSESLRRSILQDAKADLVIYGMGERAMLEAAIALDQQQEELGEATPPDLPRAFAAIRGTARMGTVDELADIVPEGTEVMHLPSHESIEATPGKLMEATLLLERHVHRGDAWAVQPTGDRAILLAPPAPPLSTEAMDKLYALPYSRAAHPSYRAPIPAEEMIRASITTHRGCGGGCSFCSLALHQGRRIASRSRQSVLEEVSSLRNMKRWNGSISDVGGPSANMWNARCTLDPARCRRSSCMHPTVCKGFAVNQTEGVDLLRTVRAQPGVKHVRVASGVRFDLALKDETALRAYTMEFTGGQLKVAPEHCSDTVLDLMRKPGMKVFEAFLTAFERHSRAAGKEQYVIPYLLSGFPGCTDDDMRKLARWLAERGWSPQQVQCFIPTPGTVATAMYYAGIDPGGNAIYVARTDAERLRQHRILMPDFGSAPPRRGAPRGDARHTARPSHRTNPYQDQPADRGPRPAGQQDTRRARRDDNQTGGYADKRPEERSGDRSGQRPGERPGERSGERSGQRSGGQPNRPDAPRGQRPSRPGKGRGPGDGGNRGGR